MANPTMRVSPYTKEMAALLAKQMHTSAQEVLELALHSLKRQLTLELANRDYAALQRDSRLRQMRERQREARKVLEQERLDREWAAQDASK